MILIILSLILFAWVQILLQYTYSEQKLRLWMQFAVFANLAFLTELILYFVAFDFLQVFFVKKWFIIEIILQICAFSADIMFIVARDDF